jgi:hypothetical protein
MPLTYQASTGATFGATTVTLPTHAVGDIIVLYVDIGATGTAAAIPSAGGTVPTWTNIAKDDTNGQRLAYTVATATNHTSGTWTGGNTIMSVVLRGQKATSPIGGNAFTYSTTSASSVTAPAVTLSNSDGSSQVLHFFDGLGPAAFNWNAAPTGYTSRLSVNSASSINVGYRVLTKDSTTSDGSVTNTTSAAVNTKWSASVEILAAPSSGFFAMF